MARMMRTQNDGLGWAGDAPTRSAGRRAWASSAWLVAGTIAVAVSSYSLSLKVASERRNVERLARQNSALESDLKALDAELRVRMRMPQLQRWNDTVLGLVPISASQYLANPVQLAAYGDAPAAPALPRVQLAVRDVAPEAQQRQPAPILTAAPAAPAAPTLQKVVSAAPLPAAPVIARPQPQAPDDLLQQVELEFGGAQPPTP
jgi:hypothetical protein